jgi:hypothetical protein
VRAPRRRYSSTHLVLRGLSRFQLPLLGSNQDSPDPEGPLEQPKLQQLATIFASSCHPMLEFAGFDARLCRTLLAQMSGFVTEGLTLLTASTAELCLTSKCPGHESRGHLRRDWPTSHQRCLPGLGGGQQPGPESLQQSQFVSPRAIVDDASCGVPLRASTSFRHRATFHRAK